MKLEAIHKIIRAQSDNPPAVEPGQVYDEPDPAQAQRLLAMNAVKVVEAPQPSADRIAAEKAEADRIAAEKAEADRIAAEKAKRSQKPGSRKSDEDDTIV